ncbi:hypothetical protein [Streptomyces sp. NPDC050485]|uniref:hypothetical protein n=1 Tax=Streptomyces sp. NPDC050485 TaxID=3365617 RepID=UPI00379DB122
MKATLRSRTARTLAAGALSAALLSAGAAGTFASAATSPKPSPSVSASKSTAAITTIKATPESVKAGDKVTFTGRTKGMPIGSKLVLQHMKGGKWTTLQASTTVKQGSSYSLDAKLNDKGKQELRVKYDEVTSPTVTVTVK